MSKNDTARLLATISYLTLVGWVIAYVLNKVDLKAIDWKAKNNEFVTYHCRQSLSTGLLMILLGWMPAIGRALALIIVILAIVGLVGALQYKKKPIPLIGEPSQEIFSKL